MTMNKVQTLKVDTAIAILVDANKARLHGWASMYAATVAAVAVDTVTVARLASRMNEDGNPWVAAGFAKASAETLRSYETAATITAALPETLILGATVANGTVHKTMSSAKAYGVPAGKVTEWARRTVTDINKATDDEGKAAALKASLDGLKAAGQSAKSAKVTTESGPAKGTDETDETDATVEAVTAPATVETLAQAAAGPVGSIVRMLADGYVMTADDAASVETLATMLASILRTVRAAA